LPILPRAGAPEPPTKSKRAKLREIEDVKREGNWALLTIRLLMLGLGVLMVLWNGYAYSNIEEDVNAIKQAALVNSGARVDPAKVEVVANNLRIAMKVECGIYLTLGFSLCVLAGLIHLAPVVCTWAALGTYVAAWVIDLLVIQSLFGEYGLGFAILNLGTVVKLAITSGLWYGVKVGQAYDEQVIRPSHELSDDSE
jgi:hypothetical protein